MIDLKPRGDSGEERDPDGVRVVARDGAAGRRVRLFQGLALLLAAACAGYILMPRSVPQRPATPTRDLARTPADPALQVADAQLAADASSTAAAAKAPAEAKPAAPAASTRSLTPRRTASKRANDAPPEEEEEESELPIPKEQLKNVTMGDYIQALHDAGIYEGIGAFNPPGTSPPLEGLTVPEDYQLPEGYVRHYQSTDDGQPIEPILMYSPDYEFLDENGQPIEIPENRVVPPEHAPPGLPLRPVEIPQPREPGDLRR